MMRHLRRGAVLRDRGLLASSAATAQHGYVNVLDLGRVRRVAPGNQGAVVEQVPAVSDGQNAPGLLLHEERREPRPVAGGPDSREQPVGDERRQPERQFIDEQRRWLGRQCPRERDHLLLPAGEQARPAVQVRFELGEGLQRSPDTASSEPEIVAHAQGEDDRPFFRHEGQAVARHPMQRRRDRRATPADHAGHPRQHTRRSQERCRLARAIGPEQRGDLARADLDTDVADGRDISVTRGEPLEREHDLTRSRLPGCCPRYRWLRRHEVHLVLNLLTLDWIGKLSGGLPLAASLRGQVSLQLAPSGPGHCPGRHR